MAEINTENGDQGLNIGVPESVVAAGAVAPAVEVKTRKQEADKGGFWWGTGRRKSSTARVRLKPGEGKFVVNKRELDNYFPRLQDRNIIMSPFKTIEGEGKFDVFVNVKGGGSTGQAGATLLGIARALGNYDPGCLPALRDGGYLTRDSRMVERKKPGQKKARKAFQFSKR
jgi:small subunit ribosomal protein S9